MAGAPPSFLGKGWTFPPSFSAGGRDVHMVANEEDVRQSLQVLLSTVPGERVMLEDFGCDLQRCLFEEVSQGLVNSLTTLITDAVLNYEPRIDLDRVVIEESDQTPGLLLIGITYRIRSIDSRFNMVFPFYLNEAIQPGTG